MPVELIELIKQGDLPTGLTQVNHVAYGQGEVIQCGPMKVHILEDGSRTDNRFGSVRFIVPPKTEGPPQHLHLMHDETFMVMKGIARFSTPDAHIDAGPGDLVTVPPRAIHTFSNPFDEPAEIVCNFTPAYYVEYLRLIAMATKSEKGVTREAVAGAMANYATIQVKPPTKS